MMKIKKTALLALFMPVLAGCFSSQASTFYLLSAMPPDQSIRNQDTFSEITVYLKPVKFPEYLDRPQMVFRESNYKLQFSEYHRWAEPLKDNFTQVLIENLNKRIAPGSVIVFSKTERISPDYQLAVEVLRLDTSSNHLVELKVNWSLKEAGDGTGLNTHTSEYSVSLDGTGYEAGVKAQSKAVSLFADQVTKTLLNFRKGLRTK